MILSDLATIGTVRVNLVGGDRIFRQGSTIKRVFLVTVNGVPADITFLPTPSTVTAGIRVQYRDKDNDQLIMTGVGTREPSLGTGYFSTTIDSVTTEAVDPAVFPFLTEVVRVGREDLDMFVLTGVYDVEFFDNTTPPAVVGCPVAGFWKMARGVTR